MHVLTTSSWASLAQLWSITAQRISSTTGWDRWEIASAETIKGLCSLITNRGMEMRNKGVSERSYSSGVTEESKNSKYLRSLISKLGIFKNMKIELTLDSYTKFKVESVPGVHSSQNIFLLPPKWVWSLQSGSKHNISSQICIKMQQLKMSKKSLNIFFFLNKLILQLKCFHHHIS